MDRDKLFFQKFLDSKKEKKSDFDFSVESSHKQQEIKPSQTIILRKEKVSPTWLLNEENRTIRSKIRESEYLISFGGRREEEKVSSALTQPRLSFSESSEKMKKSVSSFVSRLKELSSLRKIPSLFSNQSYETINDIAYFPKSSENKTLGFSTKFLKSLKVLAFIKKCFKDLLRNPAYVIHPYQSFKIFWDVIQFIMRIFLFFYIPLDITFEFPDSKTIRLILGCLMLFDNFLRFSTAYFYHGKLITDRKKIAKAYATDFILDLLTQVSMVYDIFLNQNQTFFAARLLKLVVLFQYRKFRQIYETLVDRFKIDMKFGYSLDFLKLMTTSIGVMHWVACIWYGVAVFSGEDKTWLDLQDIGEKSNYQKYVYSLYWAAVTMMTVGYGDITPQNTLETIFVIIIVVVGCGLFAYYIKYLN